MKRLLYYLLPARMRMIARRIYFLPIDLFESLTGKRPAGIPPRGMIFVGYGDYVRQGQKFLEYFRKYGNLQPHHKVLDVGCGIGRMAYPLTTFLSADGSYDGFDIVKPGIDWCNKHISGQFPNFRFVHTSLYNKLYNTSTLTAAKSFQFPYDDHTFDFVFLTSVFTHMMPDEVSNYIRQISRVMKPGAHCLTSFFLINKESDELMESQPTHMNFPIRKGFYRLHSQRVDTANVAYDEAWVMNQFEVAGLTMTSVLYGEWCGRSKFLDYQDLIIFTKAHS